MNDPTHRWKHPVRVVLFLLKAVEAERHQWQSEVLRALDLHRGNAVVDLGFGAGYFTLKVGPIVGSLGKVTAVDVRKLSLLFLRVRAFLRNEHNIEVIFGDQDDPHCQRGMLIPC